MPTRRDFLKTGAAAGGAILVVGSPVLAQAATDVAVTRRDRAFVPLNMRISP